MARPPSITYEQVAASADALVLAGARPAVRTVHESLGGTGNFGTISKHLQAWRSARQRAAGIGIVLPSEVQREILAFVEREVAGAKVSLESEIADNQRELADLAAENERLADRMEVFANQAAANEARKEELNTQVVQLRQTLDKSIGDLAHASEATEALRLKLAKAELKLERMPELETTATEDREARIAAQLEAAVLHSQVAGLNERLAESIAQLAARERLIAEHATRIELQNTEITELKVMLAHQSTEDRPTRESKANAHQRSKGNGGKSAEGSLGKA